MPNTQQRITVSYMMFRLELPNTMTFSGVIVEHRSHELLRLGQAVYYAVVADVGAICQPCTRSDEGRMSSMGMLRSS